MMEGTAALFFGRPATIREENVSFEKKRSGQRRDETIDRRQEDRRKGSDRRQGSRRAIERRREICPVCSAELTPTRYCASCKMKVIKIRD